MTTVIVVFDCGKTEARQRFANGAAISAFSPATTSAAHARMPFWTWFIENPRSSREIRAPETELLDQL